MTKIDPIELTRRLVAFDTVNPPGNERPCLDYLANILSNVGFDITMLPFGTGRDNMVARLGTGDGPPLCFSGHLDTVPLGDAAWSCDPFGGEIRGGRMMGRGTSDMKAGVAAFVCACLREAFWLRDGPGVVLALTSAEETGSEGAFDMVRRGQPGKVSGLIVAEPTSNQVKIGHKGAFWLRAHVSGVTAHGSMPHLGVNAISKAVEAIARVQSLTISDAGGAALGAPTLNVSQIAGGSNINSVPDHCEFLMDIRSNERMNHADVLHLLNATLVDVQIEVLTDLPSVYTHPDELFVRCVLDVTRAVTGDTTAPGTTSYFTDAAAFCDTRNAPPCIILGPGNADMAHRTDEYCDVAMIHQAVDIYRALIQRWVLPRASSSCRRSSQR
jgi:succinyl-diaminopimelate desuccinylase